MAPESLVGGALSQVCLFRLTGMRVQGCKACALTLASMDVYQLSLERQRRLTLAVSKAFTRSPGRAFLMNLSALEIIRPSKNGFLWLSL